MKKSRLSTRIKDKTGIAKSKNRSEDLAVLREQYVAFSKNIKFLITTLTNAQSTRAQHSKARLEVAKAVNSLTVDTPLFQCAGDIPAAAVGTTDGGESTSTTSPGAGGGGGGSDGGPIVAHNANPQSYAAIHLQLHKKNKMYGDKYQEHILDYAKEWSSILQTRISKHLKQAEKLRVDLDHYGKKVEDLNKSMNKTMSKGKSVKDAGVDKVKRNEQKLVQARQEYDRFVNDLCGFIEEVIERGWKDLHPLLVKMAQFDATLSSEECALLKGSMTVVTERLKGMGATHPNLKPQGRLKELETWSLESLNKVNPGSGRGEGPLMIEQGMGESARYLTSATSESSLGIHAGLGGGGGAGGGGSLGGSLTTGGGPGNNFPDVGGGSLGMGGGPGGGPTDAFGRQMSRDNSFANSSAAGSSDYDWASGGGGNGLLGPNLGPGNSGELARTASGYRSPTAPSSGGMLPPLNPGNRAGSFGMPPRANSTQDMSATSVATSGMLSAMQAAPPPPSMGEIFGGEPTPGMGGGGGGMGGGGMPPPPPPSMPPPPPPQSNLYDGSPAGSSRALVPQMSGLSMYDTGGGGGGDPRRGSYMTANSNASMGLQSVGSSSTNPFDNDFGGGGGGAGAYPPPAAPPQPHAAGGAYPSPAPPQPHAYGGGSTNPFG